MSSTEISFTEVKVFKKEYKEERSPRTLRINVSGTIFIVQLSSLRRFPNSRLARLADEYSLSSEPGTIYFDQDAMLFGHILRCCRSGEIHISALVCPCEFLRDMQFWGIPVEKISPCCWPTFYNADTVLSTFNKLTQMTPQPHAEDKNYTQLELKEKIWRFLDDPSHSRGAKIWYYIYLGVVGLSTVIYLIWMEPSMRVEPYLQHIQYDHNHSNEKINRMVETDPHAVLFTLDLICILVFAIEFVLRFATCPSKQKYFTKWYNAMNGFLVGTMVTSFILEVRKDLIHTHAMGFFYYIMKNSYVLRLLLLLRLEKRYMGLKILMLTVKESAKELFLLLFLLIMATCIFGGLMFCAEMHTTQYPDIGVSLWWALVTISTIGYGDYYPTDLPGRIIGSLCAVSGIIMLALPIAVISSEFSNFYSHRFYQKRHHKTCSENTKI